jgi:hypothetical protein
MCKNCMESNKSVFSCAFDHFNDTKEPLYKKKKLTINNSHQCLGYDYKKNTYNYEIKRCTNEVANAYVCKQHEKSTYVVFNKTITVRLDDDEERDILTERHFRCYKSYVYSKKLGKVWPRFYSDYKYIRYIIDHNQLTLTVIAFDTDNKVIFRGVKYINYDFNNVYDTIEKIHHINTVKYEIISKTEPSLLTLINILNFTLEKQFVKPVHRNIFTKVTYKTINLFVNKKTQYIADCIQENFIAIKNRANIIVKYINNLVEYFLVYTGSIDYVYKKWTEIFLNKINECIDYYNKQNSKYITEVEEAETVKQKLEKIINRNTIIIE